MKLIRFFLFSLLGFVLYPFETEAIEQNTPESVKEFIGCNVGDDSVQTDSIENKHSFFNKIKNYFKDANKQEKDKRFDFSIIGGPHYSTDTKLGLGIVAAGLYSTDRSDSLLIPSNVSLYGDVSTVGFYLIGIRGNNIFPKDRYRLNYNLYFFSFPSYYWGSGYEMNSNDYNKSKYNRFQAQVKVDFLWRVANNLYIGPMAVFDYINSYDFEKPGLLMGEDMRTVNTGVGFSVQYDSRDFLTNASRGYYLKYEQKFCPAFMGNEYAYSSSELTANMYKKVWKGAILAGQFHTLLNYGNPHWSMLASLGTSNSMRGYYEGRYRDKCVMDAQIELRQHVWRRNGITLWAGAGTVFPKISEIKANHILPNYGIGYRWEFKKRVNVRLDLGFGKGQTGFIFNINEAF